MSTTVRPIEPTTTPQDRRADLARAAYEMIAERGIDGLSLRALARRFGATTGLVSHHFVDRAELVEAALDHATAVVVGRITSLGRGGHPLELLAAVLPVDPASAEQWRFAFSLRTATLFDPSLARFDRAIRTSWQAGLPKRLAGHVDGDPKEAARQVVALVDGIAFQAVLDPSTWTPERQLAHLRRGFSAVADHRRTTQGG
jgi:AcrR family transcriptional regulator